ncbi:MAG: serpin family protein [Deltaproteobacteria bacterium]|jgi:serpin B|nr:serpin family protein [Deltaproteobacteria bacterium]
MTKKLGFLTAFSLFSLFAAPLWAATEPQALGVDPAYQKAAAAETTFALELYGQLKEDGGDIFFSPLSVAAVLDLLKAGAKGETLSQLALVLNRTGEPHNLSFAEFSQYLKDKATKIAEIPNEPQDQDQDKADPAPKPTITLALANSLWPQEGLKIRPEYLKALGETPPLYPVDYQKNPEDAINKINAWVQTQTQDKIVNLLTTPLPPNSTLVLINAVYFLGQWTHPFDLDKTSPREFNRPSGDKTPVPFLNQTRSWLYLENDLGQIIKLPYGDESLSFLVLLPQNKPTGLADLEKNLTRDNLVAWRAALTPKLVKLALPKFKIVWGTSSLKPALEKMGLTLAFETRADFSGLAEKAELFVGDILQKAFVGVDEKGTEAAAATAAIMPRSAFLGEPINFVADRPFIFLIQEEATGAILFLGRLTDPIVEAAK